MLNQISTLVGIWTPNLSIGSAAHLPLDLRAPILRHADWLLCDTCGNRKLLVMRDIGFATKFNSLVAALLLEMSLCIIKSWLILLVSSSCSTRVIHFCHGSINIYKKYRPLSIFYECVSLISVTAFITLPLGALLQHYALHICVVPPSSASPKPG